MLALRDAISRSADDFWAIWCKSAEECLFRAYSKAGGPTEAGNSAFLGRGLLRIRSRRLGGRAVGSRGSSRVFRASQADDVDMHCAQYFVNSSLAPVVLFRSRLKSVADVLKGIRSRVFTQSRWDALLGFWDAVCCIDPSLQDNVVIQRGFFHHIYHIGCAFNLHSIINNGLIPGGQNSSKRQTVFFLPIDPRDREHKDPEKIDFSVPRRAQYLHSAWKKHQDAVYWVEIDLAIRKGFTFYQTRSKAIILQGTLPAYCIPKVVRLKTWRSLI